MTQQHSSRVRETTTWTWTNQFETKLLLQREGANQRSRQREAESLRSRDSETKFRWWQNMAEWHTSESSSYMACLLLAWFGMECPDWKSNQRISEIRSQTRWPNRVLHGSVNTPKPNTSIFEEYSLAHFKRRSLQVLTSAFFTAFKSFVPAFMKVMWSLALSQLIVWRVVHPF